LYKPTSLIKDANKILGASDCVHSHIGLPDLEFKLICLAKLYCKAKKIFSKLYITLWDGRAIDTGLFF